MQKTIHSQRKRNSTHIPTLRQTVGAKRNRRTSPCNTSQSFEDELQRIHKTRIHQREASTTTPRCEFWESMQCNEEASKAIEMRKMAKTNS